MIIILSQICEHDMELLLIMMDYDNINKSFKFKSHLGIKCQGFLIILTDLPLNFMAIYDIQLHIKHNLHLEISCMALMENCHTDKDIKAHLNQLHPPPIPVNIRQLVHDTQNQQHDLQQFHQIYQSQSGIHEYYQLN